MKALSKFAVTCGLLFATSGATADRQLLDRILAVVNDDVILHSQLQERVEEIRARYAGNPAVLPAEDDLAEQILDTLILEQVQIQRARDAGISVTDAELNSAITDIAARQNLSLTQFQQALQQQGIDYANVRRQIRQDIQIRRAQQRFVARTIQVTDAEVRQYLQTQVSAALEESEYRIQHLLIPASESNARQVAQDVADRVNGGEGSLEAVASNTRTVQDLGWRKPEDLPQLLQGPVRGLTKGSASAPFESRNGWHVVYLADQTGTSTQAVTEYRARHLLLNNSAGLTDEAAEQLIWELYQQITEDGADFAALAEEYSVDDSAEQGGDLGWNAPGVFVPEFAEALRNTPIDGISEPVQTPFGWHIIAVEGERQTDQSFENLRDQVRDILFEQKYTEALPRWQQEIKNNAYISLRTDQP
ncbi:MAG: peptidylprolyl isomerase [Natronospirillum sp.]